VRRFAKLGLDEAKRVSAPAPAAVSTSLLMCGRITYMVRFVNCAGGTGNLERAALNLTQVARSSSLFSHR